MSEQMKKCQNCKCESLVNGTCLDILYNLSKGVKEYMPVILIEKCKKWDKNTEREVKTYEKVRT